MRGNPGALAVRSHRTGVRDIEHQVFQMTPVVVRGQPWGGPPCVRFSTGTTPNTPHLSTHSCTTVHGQDVMVGQDMIVAQEPADREGWSGGGMSSPQAQPPRDSNCQCRVPCGPAELDLELGCKPTKNGWTKQRLGRPFSHREPSLQLQ